MSLSKQILFLLCFFSATSSWLVAFPGFEEADLEKECEILESNLLDGPTTSTSNTESGLASSSVHSTQTSSSSNMMNSIPLADSHFAAQTTEVDLSAEETSTSTNAENSFGVSIKKVAPPLHDFKRLTFEKQGHSLVVAGMFIPDLEGKLAQYEEKINELKAKDPLLTRQTEQERKVFTDASEVIKAGQQYFQNVMEESGKKAFWNTKQPAVSFATALNQEQEILNKNIDKIIEIATRVEELHELKNKWTISCNELKEEGQAESDRGVLLNVQINKAQETINQYLQFAETIRDKDVIEKDSPRMPSLMAAAKEAKERGHANYSSVLKFEANERHDDYWRQAQGAETQGNWGQFHRYQDAAYTARKASMQFQDANKARISEDAQNAYNLSGRYYLRQVEEIIKKNRAEEVRRYRRVAWSACVAASQFEQASIAGISEEEKNVWNLSARYYLQQVQAIIQGNEAEASQYGAVAWAAGSAAERFQRASKADISEDEKNAYNLSARYYLQQVQAIIQGNETEASQYGAVALAAGSAAMEFQRANKAGISEDAQNMYILSGRYKLKQAEAIIQGNVVEANLYGKAAEAVQDAAEYFQYANRILTSEDEKNAWNFSGRYHLQQAEAILQGNEIQAKRYDDASQAASSAAGVFNEATSKRRSLIQKENSVWNFDTGCYEENRSEDEKNAWNLSGRFYLQQAQAIIQGNEAEAKQYRIAAYAADSAASRFREAREDGISESQCSHFIQAGNDFLAQANRLNDKIIQAQKQKEAEEQTKERYKEYHQKYNSRSSFKRGL